MSQLSRKVLLDFPASLNVTTFSNTRLDLTWGSVLGAVSYKLYRNGVLTDSLAELSASATGLTGSTQYLFQVSCIDSDGAEGPKCPTAPGTTFATPDTIAPTTPVISAGGATLTSVVITLVAPAIDTGSGIASYTLQRATNSGFTANLVTTTGLTTFPLTVTSLLSATQYFFRLFAIDNAGNVGSFSATASITTLAAQSVTWWRNWPIPNVTCLQGSSANTILDPARWAELADKDAMIGQGNYPTVSRNNALIAALIGVRVLNPGFKFLPHVMAQETLKVAQSPALNSELEIAYNIVNSPTRGRESWYVHRVGAPTSAGRVEPNNSPSTKNQLNMACLVSGLNSLGRNFAYEFWQEWDTLWGNASANLLPHIDGAFQDNFNQRPPDMSISNGAVGVTDHDFDGNGTIDSRTDFSAGANAGGRKWAEGHREFIAQFYARFPTKVLLPNRARGALDYLDGDGSPPLPLSSGYFYRLLPVKLREHMNLLLGLIPGTSTYTFNGGGSVLSFFRTYEIEERELLPDAQNTLTGKSCVWLHSLGIDRAATADDYTYARFISALALMVERGAPCVQLNSDNPLSLDECLIELGAPAGTRTMGPLDESTATFPALRTADQSVGVARFYWTIFAKGIVVVRTDAPTVGVYPSADAAVTCTLPTPPVGKKWQRFNAATYQNPVTARSMRGQDLALNSGADVTTVALKPYHAIFLRLV